MQPILKLRRQRAGNAGGLWHDGVGGQEWLILVAAGRECDRLMRMGTSGWVGPHASLGWGVVGGCGETASHLRHVALLGDGTHVAVGGLEDVGRANPNWRNGLPLRVD